MRTRTGKLSALAVARAKRGMHGDGDGLYLKVTESESQSWVLRYKLNGKARYLGLGPVSVVGLAKARELAAEARLLILAGKDPIDQRRAAAVKAAKRLTFDECARAFIADNRAGWRSVKHPKQFERSLTTFASPVIGALPVDEITVDHALKILSPIWATRTVTASRVRGRIETVLDWAKARSYRSGENPATWRGNLKALLPAPRRVHREVHHAALAYGDVPTFVASLRSRDTVTARALEFLILTATRTSETLKARWTEFDLEARVWSIPANRMKAGAAFRVPLSDGAMAVLGEMAAVRSSEFVFPGLKPGQSLGPNALHRLMRGRGTVHGCRSSFRDWCGDATSFPREIAEGCLAHRVGNSTEAAYKRSDALERRRALMAAWSDHVGGVDPGNVVKLAR